MKLLKSILLSGALGLVAYRVLPGHKVEIGEGSARLTAAPGTANGFMVGFTERGPVDSPILTVSLADAVQKCGERLEGNPTLHDSLDTAFREGASAIYIGRIVGPAAATALGQLIDAGSKPTLEVYAASPGDWGNDIVVKSALSGGNFVLTVEYLEEIVEVSPSLADAGEAVAWAEANSEYIVLQDLTLEYEATGDPKTQTESLEGGDSDIASATVTQLEAALALFSRDLGPGQVAAPGFTAEDVHLALLAHADANNRRALCDDVDTAEEATLAEHSLGLRAAPDKAARFGSLWAPWALVPGLTKGTTRTVPYSAVQMGLIARAEGEGLTANQAAAGKRGRCRFVTGLTQDYTDAQRETLNDAGVNVAILVRGVVTTYGNRSLTNPITDGDWKSFSASRLVMAVAAAADLVLENYDFEEIDGHGYVFKKLQGDLAGNACMPFYIANSLYGTTPQEAFNVNTGPDVNTPASIAAEEIKAKIGIRVSPTGESLTTIVSKVPVTESL